jgi:ABC-type branched-subunit amino acid transport system substrate-binding protein
MDYYAETHAIAAALASEGLSSDAEALRDAIAAGSTGTEILMHVRWLLRQLDEANKTSSLVTKRKIRDVLAALDRALS